MTKYEDGLPTAYGCEVKATRSFANEQFSGAEDDDLYRHLREEVGRDYPEVDWSLAVEAEKGIRRNRNGREAYIVFVLVPTDEDTHVYYDWGDYDFDEDERGLKGSEPDDDDDD